MDVQKFELNLENYIFELYNSLKNKTYIHSGYKSFYVNDPKLRHIHKASVRDRVLHQAIFRILYSLFDQNFIYDSYSCRVGKGTHCGVNRLRQFLNKASNNNRYTVYALKCDVRKFFDSINHNILTGMFEEKIKDKDTILLLDQILDSFFRSPGIGLPLGNVTSQLFANIYLNQFDQFIKHELKIQYYLRYCDDFIIVNTNQEYLLNIIPMIDIFLKSSLGLELHPNKIIIRKYRQGVDFLGYVVLPYHRMLRTKTRRRILKKAGMDINKYSLQSYLGILSHCNGYKIKRDMLEKYGVELQKKIE